MSTARECRIHPRKKGGALLLQRGDWRRHRGGSNTHLHNERGYRGVVDPSMGLRCSFLGLLSLSLEFRGEEDDEAEAERTTPHLALEISALSSHVPYPTDPATTRVGKSAYSSNP